MAARRPAAPTHCGEANREFPPRAAQGAPGALDAVPPIGPHRAVGRPPRRSPGLQTLRQHTSRTAPAGYPCRHIRDVFIRCRPVTASIALRISPRWPAWHPALRAGGTLSSRELRQPPPCQHLIPAASGAAPPGSDAAPGPSAITSRPSHAFAPGRCPRRRTPSCRSLTPPRPRTRPAAPRRSSVHGHSSTGRLPNICRSAIESPTPLLRRTPIAGTAASSSARRRPSACPATVGASRTPGQLPPLVALTPGPLWRWSPSRIRHRVHARSTTTFLLGDICGSRCGAIHHRSVLGSGRPPAASSRRERNQPTSRPAQPAIPLLERPRRRAAGASLTHTRPARLPATQQIEPQDRRVVVEAHRVASWEGSAPEPARDAARLLVPPHLGRRGRDAGRVSPQLLKRPAPHRGNESLKAPAGIVDASQPEVLTIGNLGSARPAQLFPPVAATAMVTRQRYRGRPRRRSPACAALSQRLNVARSDRSSLLPHAFMASLSHAGTRHRQACQQPVDRHPPDPIHTPPWPPKPCFSVDNPVQPRHRPRRPPRRHAIFPITRPHQPTNAVKTVDFCEY